MAREDIAVKKYVVRLSAEEREQLQALIRKGKSPAKRLLKARILLKADVSETGEGWSDSWIVKALDTSESMVYRVRKQLVEEGFAAVLSRKQRATPAVARIFDGEKEAKLIALACSKPPKGRARWTLRLLENKVVELGIVDLYKFVLDLTLGTFVVVGVRRRCVSGVTRPAAIFPSQLGRRQGMSASGSFQSTIGPDVGARYYIGVPIDRDRPAAH